MPTIDLGSLPLIITLKVGIVFGFGWGVGRAIWRLMAGLWNAR